MMFFSCRGPAGSGRCDCDAGYTGNGTNCAGKLVILMHVVHVEKTRVRAPSVLKSHV